MIISGSIVDVAGTPLMGASIYPLKNGESFGQGLASDYDGNFNKELTDVTSDTKVVISYMGFKTINTTVGELQNKKITMLEDAEQLDEVVITYEKPKSIKDLENNNKTKNYIMIGVLGILSVTLAFVIIKKMKNGK